MNTPEVPKEVCRYCHGEGVWWTTDIHGEADKEVCFMCLYTH